jgi:spermidine synthase
MPVEPARRASPWLALFFASGATALVYEVLWMRRLGLVLGGSALSVTLTLTAFMAGLALGALVVSRIPALGWRGALRAYAGLELVAALWALAFPWLLDAGVAALPLFPGAPHLLAFALMLPPATALGATWPIVARQADASRATGLYAANTSGAVLGALLPAFIGMPLLGVRATELAAAAAGLAIAGAAWAWSGRGAVMAGARAGEEAGASSERAGAVDLAERGVGPPARAARGATCARWLASPRSPNDLAVLFAVGAAGFAALGLEVVWMRLAAVALGGSVHTFAVVLAAFLVAVAAGAWLGRRWPADPEVGLAWSLGALGGLALLGAAGWGLLPYGVAGLYAALGAEGLLLGSAGLAALAMGGAPVASGAAFACAVRCRAPTIARDAPRLYLANTVGCIGGSALGGLWALPTLQAHGATTLFALVAASAGAVVIARPWPIVAPVALALLLPGWDARLYAVGVHLRVSDFADPSAAEIRRFADEGWDLLFYEHGPTAAVAVGRSRRTGNVWLSTNGKVDASTGDDMPTQLLSGRLPVAIAADPSDVLVVGLASGVTTGAALQDARVRALTTIEIEPAIVRASRFFEPVNGRPLDDPRATLVLDDARAWLRRTDRTFDVIISEPSNPWITGVSNLFTAEYWRLTRARLRPDGVMVQWVQLYGMGPEELRGLVRTFLDVYPSAWLFETIPGSDVLLIAAPSLPPDLPIEPTLGPAELRAFAGEGWRNTDDFPRVELWAPFYLHYDTGNANARRIEAARGR